MKVWLIDSIGRNYRKTYYLLLHHINLILKGYEKLMNDALWETKSNIKKHFTTITSNINLMP